MGAFRIADLGHGSDIEDAIIAAEAALTASVYRCSTHRPWNPALLLRSADLAQCRLRVFRQPKRLV